MSRQHFLPASYLAGFSSDVTSFPLRERVLSVLRNGRVFLTKAEKVAFRHNLYTLENPHTVGTNSDPDFIDRSWRLGEHGLPLALHELRGSHLNGVKATTWLNVLVPFVSQLFVRGIEFPERYQQRLTNRFGKLLPPVIQPTYDQINAIRWMEWQRILWGILTAEWIILHNPLTTPFITNDVGYVGLRGEFNGGHRFFIPLRRDLAVEIMPAGRASLIYWTGDSWQVSFTDSRECVDARGIIPLNSVMVADSILESYGADRGVLCTAMRGKPVGQGRWREPTGLTILNPAESQRWYFDVVNFISAPPSHPSVMLDLNDLRTSSIQKRRARVEN